MILRMIDESMLKATIFGRSCGAASFGRENIKRLMGGYAEKGLPPPFFLQARAACLSNVNIIPISKI